MMKRRIAGIGNANKRCHARFRCKNEVVGRILIAIGLVLVVAGAIVMLGDRAGIKLGRLPGDIVLRGRNSTFYFPVVTCILISVVLTILSWLFAETLGRKY